MGTANSAASSAPCRYTPHLLAYTPDAPLRNSANAAFLAMMYAKHRPAKYDCWAESQARYFMGSSGRSFMVGLGHNPPVRSYDKVCLSLGCFWDILQVAGSCWLS